MNDESSMLERVADISGGLNDDHCKELYRTAKLLRKGTIVELGSYHGRATVALAMGSLHGHRLPVYAVDPSERFEGIMGGQFGPWDRAPFMKNIERAGVAHMVRPVSLPATHLADTWGQEVMLLVLDTDYRYDALRRDYLAWRDQMPLGSMLFIGGLGHEKRGTRRLVNELLEEGDFVLTEEVGGYMAVLRRRRLSRPLADKVERGARFLPEADRRAAQELVEQAVAHHKDGELDQAEPLYMQAIERFPEHPNALVNLGLVHKARGELDAAEYYCRRGVEADPKVHGNLYNLGNVLMERDRHEEAKHLYRQVVTMRPDFVDGWLNLAICLREENALEEGLEAIGRGLEFQPENPVLQMTEGTILQHLGRFDEAEARFRAVSEKNPQNAVAIYHLGQINREQGYLDQAREHLEKVLELNPNFPGAYGALAELTKFESTDHPWFAKLEDVLEEGNLNQQGQTALCFSLGRMYAQAKDYDRSFEFYDRGNRLRNEIALQQGRRFVADNHRHRIDRHIENYSAELFEWAREEGIQGSDSIMPILVIGMPRSGTTLTESIIAAHPQGGGAGELEDLARLSGEFTRHVAYRSENKGYPENIRFLTPELAAEMAEDYLAKLRHMSNRPGAERVVDKMPGNYHQAGLFSLLFPNARIIDCRRDPVDNCLSCFTQNFAQQHDYSNDLAHLAVVYKEYERLMEHWYKVLPVPLFRLQYEQVIDNPEHTLRALFDFLEMEWDERVLDFHKSKRSVKTASVVQVRKPLYNTSVGRWKPYEKHLGPLLEGLGVKTEAEGEPEQEASDVRA